MTYPIPDIALDDRLGWIGTRASEPGTPRPCEVCGSLFRPHRRRPDARFCSGSCIWKATKGAEFNARIAKESRELRGETQRGRGEGKSYRKLNGRHEHRVIAEQMLGRPLLPAEVVHHIDGDILNNDPSNLRVMTQAEHMREHGIGQPGIAPEWKPWEARWKR